MRSPYRPSDRPSAAGQPGVASARLLLVLGALLVVAPHRPCAATTPAPTAVAPSAAALVNGIPIEAEAVQQLVKGLARAEPEPPDSARIGELTGSALESLIDLELLYQEAARRKITLAPGEVDREVDALRQHFDSEAAFVTALASRGMTPGDLRLDTRRTLMAERLLQSTVWRGLSVSSAEVERFYEDNQQQLATPLETLHDSIARMLLDDKKAARRAELIAELRESATIVRFPPYGNDARETRPTEQAGNADASSATGDRRDQASTPGRETPAAR